MHMYVFGASCFPMDRLEEKKGKKSERKQEIIKIIDKNDKYSKRKRGQQQGPNTCPGQA